MSTNLAKIIADFSTQMATKNAVGDTTGTLQSATDDDGVSLPAGQYYFTIDGDNSNKEYIQAQVSGTGLTSIKSVSRQGVITSGFARVHRVGASVEVTDFAILKMLKDLLDGTTDLNASTPLKYDGTATISNANHLATKAYVDGVAIAGAPDSSTTVKGITKMSVAPASATAPIAVGDNDPRVPTQSENDAMAGTSGSAVSSSNPFIDNSDSEGTGKVQRKSQFSMKFGGSGADGALNVTSGTTTIDAGNANVVIKNYTSINISAGATLTISNPGAGGTILILKSQGNVTIAGTIDLNGKGGASAVEGFSIVDDNVHKGGTGSNGSGSTGGAAGTVGTILANRQWYSVISGSRLYRKVFNLACGSGGGPGGNGSGAGAGTGGAGGAGGGALIVECAGALDFSGTISVNGATGSNGTTAGGIGGGGGGGGGGAAGMALLLYGSLTANTGTINAKGGAGGTGGDGNTTVGAGGGGGAGAGSYTAAGFAGGAGGNANVNGSAGTNTTNASGAGGGGGGGDNTKTGGAGGTQGSTDSNHYLVAANTYFI